MKLWLANHMGEQPIHDSHHKQPRPTQKRRWRVAAAVAVTALHPFLELASLAKHTVAKVGGVAMAMTFAARCAVHTAIVSQVIHDMPFAIQLPIALESVCLLLCNEVALL